MLRCSLKTLTLAIFTYDGQSLRQLTVYLKHSPVRVICPPIESFLGDQFSDSLLSDIDFLVRFNFRDFDRGQISTDFFVLAGVILGNDPTIENEIGADFAFLATPAELANEIASLMAKEGDVPNLDITVAACLTQEALAYGKKTACADNLLTRSIPLDRRLAVVRPYLKSVRVWGTRENNVAKTVLRAIGTNLPLAVWELFMEMATRPSVGWLRAQLLTRLCKHPEPTVDDIRCLILLLNEQELVRGVLGTIDAFVKTRSARGPAALESLRFVRPNQKWRVSAHGGNPDEEIDKSIRRLEKRLGKVY